MAYDRSDYIEVKDKLRLAYDRWPEMRIQESVPRIVEVNGDTKIEITCTIHRDPDDPMPAVFTCWEVYPGTTPFTRGSEQQNCSTSAVGRALSIAGIGLGSPVASAEDVRNAQAANTSPSEPSTGPQEPRNTQLRTTAPEGGGKRSEPTEKMLNFYRQLCKRHGESPKPEAEALFDVCRTEIDRLQDMNQ